MSLLFSMLSGDILTSYFRQVENDFILYVNSTAISCNKHCLITFCSYFSDNISGVSEYRINSDFSEKIFMEIISSMTGLNDILKNLIDPTEYYFVASFLGIGFLIERLHENFCKTMNNENIIPRYKVLSQYSATYKPFSFYINRNPTVFHLLHKEVLLVPSFVDHILENCQYIFPNENEKFLFVIEYAFRFENPPAFLMKRINIEEVSQENIIVLAKNPKSDSFNQFMSLNKPLRLFSEKASIQSSINQGLETKRETLIKQKLIKNSLIDNYQSSNIQKEQEIGLIKAKIKVIRRKTQDILTRFSDLIVQLVLVTARDDDIKIFSDLITSLTVKSEEMLAASQGFLVYGGRMIFPESSIHLNEMSKTWNSYMNNLSRLINQINPSHDIHASIVNQNVSLLNDIKKLLDESDICI